jgi:predicted HAD superfamily Cof-like phosphohydrolase
MLYEADNALREFHGKYGFPVDIFFEAIQPQCAQDLEQESKCLLEIAESMKDTAMEAQKSGDESLYRAYLMMEELGETLEAMANKDPEKFADGLADLMYVVVGTAITYGLPIAEVFAEVHRSNMTKKLRVPGNERMRDKGPSYQPPRIAEAIQRGLDRRRWEQKLKGD